MSKNRELPRGLYAAYEWTQSAGELGELMSLASKPRKLAAYARESAENARDNEVDDVFESDLEDLAAWLADEAVSDSQILALRQEAAKHGDLEMVRVCDRAYKGSRAAIEQVRRVIVNAAGRL